MKFSLSSPIIKQYVVVIAVNLIVISTGLALAWPSPVLVKLRNANETILPAPITEDEGSWVVSVGFLCAIFANFLPALLVDQIGRKNCVILGCVPKVVVGLLYTFASGLWMLLLGRVVNGISDAFIFTVVPMYASEIGSKEVRGSLGTILQIFASLGILVMLSMGPVVSYLTLNIVLTCVALVATIPVVFLPDSPYYLYSKGRKADAIKVLTQLRGSEALANEEIKEYEVSNTDSSVNKLKLFKDRTFVKSVAIVVVIGAGFQLMGFNAVSFYLQTILESTQSSISPEIGSAIIGAIQLLASICTTFITDKFGRKPILTFTIIGTAIGMWVLGGGGSDRDSDNESERSELEISEYPDSVLLGSKTMTQRRAMARFCFIVFVLGLGTFFKIKEAQHTVSGAMNYLPLVSLILVVYSFSAGPGSLYWMMVTELFDGPARGVGVACSMLTAISFIFLTTKYFPGLIAACGPAATYWVFSVNCVLLAIFILFCVPETRGRSFAEIQESLGAKKPVICEEKGTSGEIRSVEKPTFNVLEN